MAKVSNKRLRTLLLTDSTEKAKTIRKCVGNQYLVMSSDGFLRDFPKTQLGIDTENNFEPKYITVRGKGKLLEQIRKESLKARRIYALTDPDRQGEMIALHYCDLFGINPSSNFRVVLNELNKESIKNALNNARPIDQKLVNAFYARRVIERIFLYKLNPLLWHKIYRGITIGLFPALILKIICDQEKKLQPLNQIIEIAKDINLDKPLDLKKLQLAAAKELNFHIGTTAITLRQLYEGVNVGNSHVGLITYYDNEVINISSENRTPESVKEFLTPNQFKLYNLIWQIVNSNLSINPKIDGSPTRYNDYSLMLEINSKGLDWSRIFSLSLCGLIKRKFIELTDEGYKSTKLGNDVLKVLKENFSSLITGKTFNKIETQINSVLNDELTTDKAIENFYKQFNNLFIKACDKLGEDLTPQDPPPIESDEICDKCGRKMLIRRSRYGLFLACSGYPECKNTKPYIEYLDQKCPKCGGRLTKRRITRGQITYSCENFPTCDFSTWDEPQNRTCEVCGSTLFSHKFKDRAAISYCGNENCSSREDHPINKILEHQKIKAEAKKQKKLKKFSSDTKTIEE